MEKPSNLPEMYDMFDYWEANLIPFSIDDLSSDLRFSRPCFSKSEREPRPRISSTPFFPILTCKIFQQFSRYERIKQPVVNIDHRFYQHNKLKENRPYASSNKRMNLKTLEVKNRNIKEYSSLQFRSPWKQRKEVQQ